MAACLFDGEAGGLKMLDSSLNAVIGLEGALIEKHHRKRTEA